MVTKSTPNGSNLAQGGQGVPENQQKYEKEKKANGKNLNKENFFLFFMWGRFSQNSEGSTARRLLWYHDKNNDGNVK